MWNIEEEYLYSNRFDDIVDDGIRLLVVIVAIFGIYEVAIGLSENTTDFDELFVLAPFVYIVFLLGARWLEERSW